VLGSLDDASLFRARFVYDGQFRGRVLTVLDEMRIDMVKQGASAKRSVAELDALVKRHGVTLDSQAAAKTAATSGSKPTTDGRKPTSAGKTASTQKAGEPPKPKDEQTEKLERRATELAEKGLKPRDPNEKPDPNEAKPIISEDCTIEVAVGDATSGKAYVDTYKILGNTVKATRATRVSPAKQGQGYWDAEERYTYTFEGSLHDNVITGKWVSTTATEGKRYNWHLPGNTLAQHYKGTVKHTDDTRIVLFGDGTVSWESETETENRAHALVGVFNADTGSTEVFRTTRWPKRTGAAVWQIRKSEKGSSPASLK
jgi:hypothetical protein